MNIIINYFLPHTAQNSTYFWENIAVKQNEKKRIFPAVVFKKVYIMFAVCVQNKVQSIIQKKMAATR